jgi:serine/threonine protein kinase
MVVTRSTKDEDYDSRSNAIYFPEGKGYLLVKPLSGGVQANVSLVRSLEDSSLYIRKRYFPKYRSEVTIYIDGMPLEVRMSTLTGALPQGSPYFNDLVAWADYSSEQKNGQCVLIHKYINGGRLDHLIKATPDLPEAFIWHCILHVVTAIALLHGRSIVHRDLDTCNILLEYPDNPLQYPQPVVCDFGYAGYTIDKIGATFVAAKGASAQSWEDMYMFGCMLYKMCARYTNLPNNPTGSNLSAKKMQRAGLSIELCHWVDLFQKGIKAMRHSGANDTVLPTTAQVVEELLPLAQKKLDHLTKIGELYVERVRRPTPLYARPLLLPEHLGHASLELNSIKRIENLRPWLIAKVNVKMVGPSKQPMWYLERQKKSLE